MSPDDLRDEAARLRAAADEIGETNPAAAGYHRRRADWCEYLARSEEQQQHAADEAAGRR